MVNLEIYKELKKDLTAEKILTNSERNGELPFGYVIDYIKDVYNLPKTEGWDTAKAICRYFKVQEV